MLIDLTLENLEEFLKENFECSSYSVYGHPSEGALGFTIDNPVGDVLQDWHQKELYNFLQSLFKLVEHGIRSGNAIVLGTQWEATQLIWKAMEPHKQPWKGR
jgi:hypothetical protein